jgi:6-phosphogluconate dehydrogenase
MIRGEGEQKGTGRWTAQPALELGVPIIVITEAVFAPALSGRVGRGKAASRAFERAKLKTKAAGAGELEEVCDALYASRIAMMWRGGCIIRTAFLDRIREGCEAHTDAPSLLLQLSFRDAVINADQAWRNVVVLAVQNGFAVSAFASCLAYFDGLRRERGAVNLLQGLRDYFGVHTYRRTDKDGSFYIRWSQSQDGMEVDASKA